MRFVPLGVGDAFSEIHYSSSLAILEEAADGRVLLIDCPHPMIKMLREAREATGLPISADRVAGVVLTHLHADHASGIETFAYLLRFVFARKLPIIAHPDVLARLWDGHLAAGMEQLLPAVGAEFTRHTADDFLELLPLSEETPVTLGAFTVEARRTIHHIPCTALRIRADGRTLGHSADTAFDVGLVAWLAEADLILHETGHGIHTPYASLAALPAELRARMRLTHYPDGLDVEKSVIVPLRERQVYTV
jgi:glyoxylase-like metal-dependent hydrolase (beta-lactamase superfamily II)